jgi:hypothetical protein
MKKFKIPLFPPFSKGDDGEFCVELKILFQYEFPSLEKRG